MRLIDADATLNLLKSLGSRDYRRSKGTIAEAEKMLMHEEYTPTIDAAPVVHGHWIPRMHDEDHDGGYLLYHCSLCDRARPHKLDNHCPECGAKMDEVSE